MPRPGRPELREGPRARPRISSIGLRSRGFVREEAARAPPFLAFGGGADRALHVADREVAPAARQKAERGLIVRDRISRLVLQDGEKILERALQVVEFHARETPFAKRAAVVG